MKRFWEYVRNRLQIRLYKGTVFCIVVVDIVFLGVLIEEEYNFYSIIVVNYYIPYYYIMFFDF